MSSAFSSFDFLLRGGFMMYPLLLSGLIALTVIIERLFVMNFQFSSQRNLTHQVLGQLNRLDALPSVRAQVEQRSSPVATVLAAGLSVEDTRLEELERKMQNRAEEWVPRLEMRLDILDTIITAAPLMGLLGTITGMMASFQVLSEKGVNEPHAITGGVAEALIATATGLVIALICLLAYNYFNHKVREIVFEMESAGTKVLEARRQLQKQKS